MMGKTTDIFSFIQIFLACEQNLPIKEEAASFQPTLELSSIFPMVGFPLVQRPGVSKRSLRNMGKPVWL
jgi:hypothetical protein